MLQNVSGSHWKTVTLAFEPAPGEVQGLVDSTQHPPGNSGIWERRKIRLGLLLRLGATIDLKDRPIALESESHRETLNDSAVTTDLRVNLACAFVKPNRAFARCQGVGRKMSETCPNWVHNMPKMCPNWDNKNFSKLKIGLGFRVQCLGFGVLD